MASSTLPSSNSTVVELPDGCTAPTSASLAGASGASAALTAGDGNLWASSIEDSTLSTKSRQIARAREMELLEDDLEALQSAHQDLYHTIDPL